MVHLKDGIKQLAHHAVKFHALEKSILGKLAQMEDFHKKVAQQTFSLQEETDRIIINKRRRSSSNVSNHMYKKFLEKNQQSQTDHQVEGKEVLLMNSQSLLMPITSEIIISSNPPKRLDDLFQMPTVQNPLNNANTKKQKSQRRIHELEENLKCVSNQNVVLNIKNKTLRSKLESTSLDTKKIRPITKSQNQNYTEETVDLRGKVQNARYYLKNLKVAKDLSSVLQIKPPEISSRLKLHRKSEKQKMNIIFKTLQYIGNYVDLHKLTPEKLDNIVPVMSKFPLTKHKGRSGIISLAEYQEWQTYAEKSLIFEHFKELI